MPPAPIPPCFGAPDMFWGPPHDLGSHPCFGVPPCFGGALTSLPAELHQYSTRYPSMPPAPTFSGGRHLSVAVVSVTSSSTSTPSIMRVASNVVPTYGSKFSFIQRCEPFFFLSIRIFWVGKAHQDHRVQPQPNCVTKISPRTSSARPSMIGDPSMSLQPNLSHNH
ncbi:hypothetical protein Q9966_016775 [Columba livia]|nr:hypothetical protein Q9966_016775 [Columba livia]